MMRGTRKAALSLTLLVMAMSTLAACGANSAPSAQDENEFVAAVKSHGALRVGVAAAPPYVIQDTENDDWTGPYPEFVKYWAKDLGVEIEWINTTFAAMVAGIQADSYDIGLDLTDTDERRKAVAFSDPISFDVGAMIAKTDVTQTFEEFVADDSRTICNVVGSSYDAALKNGAVAIAGKTLELTSVLDCQTALNTGRVDGILYGWTAGAAYAEETSGVGILFPAKPYVQAAVGIGLNRNDTELADLINDAIADWKADPNGLAESVEAADLPIPTDYAIGEIPDYVAELSKSQFKVD